MKDCHLAPLQASTVCFCLAVPNCFYLFFVVAGAMKVADYLGYNSGSTIVTVLCDLGQRYASKIYNANFLRSKALPVAPWLSTRGLQQKTDLELALENATKEALGTV